MIIHQNQKSFYDDHHSCFYAYKCTYFRFLAILSIWGPYEDLKNLPIILKIDDFVELCLQRSLEIKKGDIHMIFLMSNKSNVKYFKNEWYDMGGAPG